MLCADAGLSRQMTYARSTFNIRRQALPTIYSDYEIPLEPPIGLRNLHSPCQRDTLTLRNLKC